MDQSRATALQDGENPTLNSGQKSVRKNRDATASIVLTIRAHWFNSWFLLWAARPHMVLNDQEHRVRWGRSVEVELMPGCHRIGGGIRYPGFASLLGVQEIEVEVAAGETVRFVGPKG